MCKYNIDLGDIIEHLCKNCKHKKLVITDRTTLIDQEDGYMSCPAGVEGDGSIKYDGNGGFSCMQGVDYEDGL